MKRFYGLAAGLVEILDEPFGDRLRLAVPAQQQDLR
jgi:hypothetical protein